MDSLESVVPDGYLERFWAFLYEKIEENQMELISFDLIKAISQATENAPASEGSILEIVRELAKEIDNVNIIDSSNYEINYFNIQTLGKRILFE